MENNKIRVLLADDHPLIINGVSQIFVKEENFDLCGVENNGKNALNSIRELKPDIAILDIEMQKMTGLEVLERLEDDIRTKVIMLSAYEEYALVKKCISLGARGYLLKRSDPEEIIRAVYRVFEGGKYISQEVSEILLDESNKTDERQNSNNLYCLTKREMEVLELIVDGFSNPDIAEKLFVSRRTIDTHRVNLMHKLDVHSTVELVKLALSNNI